MIVQFLNSLFNLANLKFSRSNASQLVTLCLGLTPVSVLCHMGDFGCGDGGWTPVMKIDGNKVRQQIDHFIIFRK